MILPIPGGRAPARRILLVVGRDNWQKSQRMSRALLGGFRDLGLDVHWEDPAGHWIYRLLMLERRFGGLPALVRKANLRLVQLLYGLLHWPYFLYLLRPVQAPEDRAARLARRIRGLRRDRRITILAYSSGGRVSSLLADELGVDRVICLGYPFKSPQGGDEPARYAHLSRLRTPMLILQGCHDEYGGLDVPDKYPLSPGIRLHFLDSDHDYDLEDGEWERVLGRIRAELEAPVQAP